MRNNNIFLTTFILASAIALSFSAIVKSVDHLTSRTHDVGVVTTVLSDRLPTEQSVEGRGLVMPVMAKPLANPSRIVMGRNHHQM